MNQYQEKRITEMMAVTENRGHTFIEQFENNGCVFYKVILKSIHKMNNGKPLYLAIGKDYTIKITPAMYEANRRIKYESA